MLYCQVYHYIYPPVELESTDEPIEGTIIFTPDIRRGEVWIENNTVVPAVPIRCDVVNGVMRFGGRDGSRFAKLMAGGPGVNPEKVHWRVSFHDMHMGEDYFKINPFIFEAVPNTTINLAEVTPVSGYTPEGIIQGPKGEPGGAATTFYGDEDPIDPLEGDTWFIPGKNGLPDEIRLYMGGEWVTIVSEEYWKVVDEKLAQSEFDLTDPEGKLAKARSEANAALDELDGKLAEASQAISDTKFDVYDPEGRLSKELSTSREAIEQLKENLKMARDNVEAAMFDINDPEGKLAKVAEQAQADLQTLDQKLYGSDGSLTLLSEKAQEAWNKAVAAGNANVVDVVYEYQQSSSDTVVPTGVWTLDPPTKDSTKFLWRRETLKYGNGDVEIKPPYPVTGPKGAPGSSGSSGADGVGVSNTVVNYQLGTSATTAPTGTWYTNVPSAKAGDYVWTRVVWTYTDGTSKTSYSVAKIGEKGEQGAKGDKGATGAKGDQGVSLTAIIPHFILATSTPAKPTVASPSGWTVAEPGYRVNYNLYRSDKVIFSDNSFSWSAVTLVQSYQVAVQALESANGKNTINTSTATTPSKNGTAVGDVWWRVDSSNNVLAQWMWNGSSWKAQKIESDVIASLDVNKLTVSSSARMKEAVIDKIWADGLVAKTVTTASLSVGPANLYRDPSLLDAKSFDDRRSDTGGYGGGGSFTVSPSTATYSVGQYDSLGSNKGRPTRLVPGVRYYISAMVRPATAVTADTAVLYLRSYPTPNAEGDYVWASPSTIKNAESMAAGKWAKMEGTFVMPEGGEYLVLGFYVAGSKNVQVTFSDPLIIRQHSSTMIQDGAITTNKVAANAIIADKLDAKAVTTDKLDTEAVTTVKLDAEAVTTGKLDAKAVTTAKLDTGAVTADKIKAEQATIDKLWVNGISAKSITATRLTVSGGNIFPDPHFRDPCWEKSGETARANGNRGELNIFASGKQVGSYYQPEGASADKAIEVEPGAAYRISSAIWTNTGTDQVDVYMRYHKKGGTAVHKWVGAFRNLPNGTDNYSITIETPDDMNDGSCTFGFYLQSNQLTGRASLWNTRIVRAADGELIVDGSISTQKIDTLDITASKFTMESGFVKTAHIHSLDAGKISAGTININRIPSITTAKLANGAVNVDKLGNTVLADGLGKWNQSILISPTIIRWKKGSATIGTVAADGLRFYSDTGVAISRIINGKVQYSTSNIVDSVNVIIDGPKNLFAVGFPDTRPNPPAPNRAMFEVHNQGDGQVKLGGTDYGGIRTFGDIAINLNGTQGTILQLFDHVNFLTDIVNHFVFNGSSPNKNFRLNQLPLMKVPVTWE